MARDSLHGFLQLGFFILGAGLCSALFQPSDSGEFVVSLCSAGLGLALVAGVVVLWRVMR